MEHQIKVTYNICICNPWILFYSEFVLLVDLVESKWFLLIFQIVLYRCILHLFPVAKLDEATTFLIGVFILLLLFFI